ncbi:hypothetical protein [Bradyrhizobium brasilense]|uniref:hypothetical protein n=1 Tax=Bradyrhizobium brasilense TaxID=1419277 RepID=UPI001E374C17|nr:hypothetical protein [Bradyrhizobium brasilense]MCC8968993.1 hypothetical protein [Bradyrhizobium brasilense]
MSEGALIYSMRNDVAEMLSPMGQAGEPDRDRRRSQIDQTKRMSQGWDLSYRRQTSAGRGVELNKYSTGKYCNRYPLYTVRLCLRRPIYSLNLTLRQVVDLPMRQDKAQDGAGVDGSLANRDRGNGLLIANLVQAMARKGSCTIATGTLGGALSSAGKRIGWNDGMVRAAECG